MGVAPLQGARAKGLHTWDRSNAGIKGWSLVLPSKIVSFLDQFVSTRQVDSLAILLILAFVSN
jgi:uncharacterized protein HemX